MLFSRMPPGAAAAPARSKTSHISTTSTVFSGQLALMMTMGPLPDAMKPGFHRVPSALDLGFHGVPIGSEQVNVMLVVSA
jgi:hypothetical protein